jgi:hypothetical protein
VTARQATGRGGFIFLRLRHPNYNSGHSSGCLCSGRIAFAEARMPEIGQIITSLGGQPLFSRASLEDWRK